MWLKLLFGRRTTPSPRTSRVKSDYAYQGGSANPLKQKLQEARRLNLSIFSVVVVIALLGACWYWIFLSGAFRINDLQIIGASPEYAPAMQSLAHDMIAKKRLYLLSAEQSIFFVDKKSLDAAFAKQFPVRRIVISPLLPHRLVISVEMRTARYLATPADSAQSYLIDEEGIVITHATSSPDRALWRLDLPVHGSAQVNERLLNEELVTFIESLHQYTSRESLNFRIVTLDLTRSAIDDAQAITDEGWRIYFSVKNDTGTQLLNVGRALQEMKDGRKKLSYIDVRIPNRIYYQ